MSAPYTPTVQRIVDAVKRNLATYEVMARHDEEAWHEALKMLSTSVGTSSFHKVNNLYVQAHHRALVSTARALMYREVENLVCGIACGADVRGTI